VKVQVVTSPGPNSVVPLGGRIVGEVVDTVVVCVVGNVGKHRDAKDDWCVTWTVKVTEPPGSLRLVGDAIFIWS
jgi:hypothetical protein